MMTRSVWSLMDRLELYTNAQRGDLSVAEWLEFRIVNMPSSVYIGGDEDR
jgi:perosamine synthetase